MTLHLSILTGISDLKGSGQITVYPNPFQDYLNIETSGGTSIEAVLLYDLYVRFLKKELISGNPSGINLSQFPAGIYLLKMQNADETMGMIRVIKK